MDSSFSQVFSDMGKNIIGYLPSLFGGLALVIIGWVLGWLVKRFIIQIAVLLRLERFLVSFKWGKDFVKADIRYSFYNYIGNIAFFVIFIIFFNDALNVLKLSIFSAVLERIIFYVPKILISLLIFGLGWFISGWSSRAAQSALIKEKVPRAILISRFIKSVLLVFFSAMAMAELDIAREIVIIGFATVFISLGALAVVLTAVGGKDFVKKLQETLGDE